VFDFSQWPEVPKIKTVLFLHAEVMGYTVATLRALTQLGFDIHVVHWDRKKLTPFIPPIDRGIRYYDRSKYSRSTLIELTRKLSPDLTVVAGWMDTDYLFVSRELRKRGVRVVVGFDDQWIGSSRQRLVSVFRSCNLLKIFFSNAWVSGARQFEYAKRFGFANHEIITDLYSCDQSVFRRHSLTSKATELSKTFLYAGRMETYKGVEDLLKVWFSISAENVGWKLTIVGNGSLFNSIDHSQSLRKIEFLQPTELSALVAQSTCCVVPSYFEPWGVVVHEFVSCGKPIIVSDAVGAGDSFLIDGFNGFKFKARDLDGLYSAMHRITQMSIPELENMGARSSMLSQRITPESSAANLISLLLQR